MKTSSTNKRTKNSNDSITKKRIKPIKKRASSQLKSKRKQPILKTKKKVASIQKCKKTKRDYLIEILKEYNLSKDLEVFEKSLKELVNEKHFQKGQSFKTLFSKILTKAYIKSKITYDFTPKDLKFIKDIINKVSPSNNIVIKNQDIKQPHEKNKLKTVSRYLAR